MTPDGQTPQMAQPQAESGQVTGASELAAKNAAPVDRHGDANFVARTVADVEQELIIDTLYHCLGNRTHAANILGISIRTLRNKLKQYSEEGVEVPMPGDPDRASV